MEGFSIQLFDEHGTDVLQGLGVGHAAATTSAPVVYANTSLNPVIDSLSVLRMHVDQTNPSAQFTMTLYLGLGA